MAIHSFKDLRVWQDGVDLVESVYDLTLRMPWPHKAEIGSQMREAAVSIPSNVAEGFRQGSTRAYLRLVRVAAGSAGELETQAIVAQRLRLLDDDKMTLLPGRVEAVSRQLSALIRALDARQREEARRPRPKAQGLMPKAPGHVRRSP